MSHRSPLLYSPDVESVPPDEVEEIHQVVQALRHLLKRDEGTSGERRRDVHVKSHGCPVAELRVLPGLDPTLREGLFREETTYPAVIRFSSSSPWAQPDALPDARGVAIKVQAVSGTFLLPGVVEPSTQDFAFANHPTFVAKDVKDYLRLQQVRLQGVRLPVAAAETFTTGSWNPIDWRWREALAAAQVATQFSSSPAALTYYSMAPFRFGQYIAKFRLRPAAGVPSSQKSLFPALAARTEAFREALTKTLQSGSLTFEFQVQLWTNRDSMPIEDATIEWPEAESPYQSVAHLEIPAQRLDTSPRGLGDDLSFNPWNALVEHQPLGGINRVRRAAYETSAAWRSA